MPSSELLMKLDLTPFLSFIDAAAVELTPEDLREIDEAASAIDVQGRVIRKSWRR